VLSWDDSSNNRAFLAEAVSVTGNAASIYWAEKKNAPHLREVTDHALWPQGSAGRFGYSTAISLGVFRFSKGPAGGQGVHQVAAGAEAVLGMDRPGRGHDGRLLNFYEDDPVWKTDRKLEVVRQISKYVRMPGYPAPPSRPAAEAMIKYVVVNMFARACKGTATAETIRVAKAELKEIYGKA
jgi:multiple sugar transport system substrate-binding protein